MKTIKVAHGVMRADTDKVFDYKVLVVKNSTDFSPGQILPEAEVEFLCDSRFWEVTIVPLNEGGKQ